MLFAIEKSCKEFNIKRHDEETSINKILSINNVFISDKVLFKGAALWKIDMLMHTNTIVYNICNTKIFNDDKNVIVYVQAIFSSRHNMPPTPKSTT